MAFEHNKLTNIGFTHSRTLALPLRGEGSRSPSGSSEPINVQNKTLTGVSFRTKLLPPGEESFTFLSNKRYLGYLRMTELGGVDFVSK